MEKITHWLLASTEDDKFCVKGGIGTYLGVLTRALNNQSPDISILWFTESPDHRDFTFKTDNTSRHYLTRLDQAGNKLDIISYANKLQASVAAAVDKILSENSQARIVIESPDWEGLLADYFENNNDPRILKVSRNHTPLSVTSEINSTSLYGIFADQSRREQKQIEHSNLSSAPTKHVLTETIRTMCSGASEMPIPSTVIPNCIDIDSFHPNGTTRAEAIDNFRKITNIRIEESAFNVFFVGSVEERKGIQIALNSIAPVLQEVPNARFYFIGHHQKDDGDSLTSNTKLTPTALYSKLPIEIRDKVFFTDYIDHAVLPSIMEAGDIFPICYLSDNFPGVVAEIGLSMRPMATIMRGGIPEMIVNNKTPLAYTFSKSDQSFLDLAQHIIAHARNPEAGIQNTKLLRNHLIQQFSPNKVANDMVRYYSNCFPE